MRTRTLSTPPKVSCFKGAKTFGLPGAGSKASDGNQGLQTDSNRLLDEYVSFP
jgi:hypothetical protein